MYGTGSLCSYYVSMNDECIINYNYTYIYVLTTDHLYHLYSTLTQTGLCQLGRGYLVYACHTCHESSSTAALRMIVTNSS